MLFAVVSLGMTSCSDDSTVTPEGEGDVRIALGSVSYTSVTFSLSTEETSYTMFAYKVAEKGSVLTAQQVFDEGAKVTAPATSAITIKNLLQATDYTVYAVAMGTRGLSGISSLDFATTSDDSAPATSASLGVRLDKVTQNELHYTLQRGTEVTSGYLCVWPTIMKKNFVAETIKESGGALTEDQVITDVLMNMGYGLQVDGTEVEANWTQQTLIPDADYTVMMLGMLDETTPGDVSYRDFKTLPYEELLGDPTVEITEAGLSWSSARFAYTLNPDAYGFMRFVGDPKEVDQFIADYGEDELREWVRHTDYLFEQIYQTRFTMEPDENGNPRKSEGFFFGWDVIPNLKVTALAVACDGRYSVSKKLARLDLTLTDRPENSEPAKYSTKLFEPTATTAKTHFEFEENCRAVYYIVLPKSGYESAIASAGGELAYARKLDIEGNGIGRTGSSPLDPIANNDWYWTNLYPGGEYVIVSTAVNYDGMLNEKLQISEPIKTLPLVFGGSTVNNISVEFDKIGKFMARGVVRVPDNDIALFYNKVFAKADSIFYYHPNDDKYLRDWIMGEHLSWTPSDPSSGNAGDIWLWLMGKSPDWDFEKQAEIWEWDDLESSTDYVCYYCAEDNYGHITDLQKVEFSTMPTTTGPKPDATLSAFDINSHGCAFDIIVNNDVHKLRYLAVEQPVLDWDPATGTDQELEDAIYDKVMELGVDAKESVRSSLTGTNMNATWYLGAILYGTKDGEQIENFKWITIQLSGGRAISSALASRMMNPTPKAAPVRKIKGSGDSKSFAGWSRANIQSLSNLRSDNSGKTLSDKESHEIISKMQGYIPMKASEVVKHYYKR